MDIYLDRFPHSILSTSQASEPRFFHGQVPRESSVPDQFAAPGN